MIATMDVESALRAAIRQPPPGPITYEQFVEWADDETHAEWVDGQVILMPVIAQRHDAIVGFLRMLFGLVIAMTGRGVVHGEPFQVHLAALRRGRAPDVFFLLEEHRSRLGKHYIEGPADIIVEVLSPESIHRDRVEKLREYQAAGVPEYWLLDDDTRRAEFRQLGPDGRYQVAFAGETGEYQSAVLPEMRLRVEWLWQERHDLNEVLRVLGLR
jgi:Uma2 family endonuclease